MEHGRRTETRKLARDSALLWLTVLGALVACGGGVGSSGSAATPQAGDPPVMSPAPAPRPAPAPASPHTSGTAAPAPAAAERTATATLSWNASTSDAVVGYRVYHGTAPGNYAQSKGAGIDVGRVTSYVVSGLATGRRHHFAVTAYGANGSESAYSVEASKDVE